MSNGKINVTADNIFPIIKKFLYSDHEIFLRELISNAVDATLKLKTLTRIGESKTELGDLTIEIKIDKESKTLTVSDKGLGMSTEEVDKYINQLAFSGAEEFVKKYEDKADGAAIIGHFGLGFYSAFMVAKKVEILSQSHNADAKAAHWECEGDPEFTLEEAEKAERGTDIILHINDDSLEFLEEARVRELLNKYCKFLPVPIKFGTKEITETVGEGEDAKEEKKVVDDIINNPVPAWTKAPSDLKDEDYKTFYRELYPHTFEEPLFHIHLNVDYPFDLTGILFFPRVKPNMELNRNKIQLYQNQVFVTDNLEGIVPDFLTMLHGVIDSKDIPLNVSRSYLQSDGAVKKISSHITKKVADKLDELFKNDRKDFESKWDDIKVIIEYGMLSDEKFFARAQKFALYQNVKGEYFTFEEYKEKVKDLQTDKDGKLVMLYAAHKDGQHSFIKRAHDKGYDVLLMDSPIVSHLMQRLETSNENLTFARVDSDSIDKLIKKDEDQPSKLTEEQINTLKPIIEGSVDKAKFTVMMENLSSDESPFIITVPEFMRRMKEMSMTGGGMMGMGNMPDMYNLVVNTNHDFVNNILSESDEEKQKAMIKQGTDLALLSQNLLQGEELTNFVERSFNSLIKS
ncbi:molecular chaperone HtpG [Owenweeksia hongkongensis]|uniref:molecular chaperone HtpG n=1 Tax=Owenweeksia hongkongensis TaxID=253245 RepID=UPI003A8EC63E